MKIFLFAILFSLFVTQAKGDDHQGRMMISCSSSDIALIPGSNKAEIIGQNSVQNGTMEQTEFFYYLKFPSTIMSVSTRLEKRYKINRSTGDYSWEFGEAYFGEGAPKGWLRKIKFGTGKCIKP